MSQRDLPRRRARRRALQGPRGREQLVEVRNLAGIVTPCAAHRTAAPDQEGRSLGDVLHPAELVGDAEPAHGVPVPVGQELNLVEVERLAPGGLRPRRAPRERKRRTPAAPALLSRRSSSSFVQVDDQANRKKRKTAERPATRLEQIAGSRGAIQTVASGTLSPGPSMKRPYRRSLGYLRPSEVKAKAGSTTRRCSGTTSRAARSTNRRTARRCSRPHRPWPTGAAGTATGSRCGRLRGAPGRVE